MAALAGANPEGKKRNRTAYEELTASGGADGSVASVDRDTPPPDDATSGKDNSVIKKKKKKKKSKDRRTTPSTDPASGANRVELGR